MSGPRYSDDPESKAYLQYYGLWTDCHAARDGECIWSDCPQLRDDEPRKSGRHCPLDKGEEE